MVTKLRYDGDDDDNDDEVAGWGGTGGHFSLCSKQSFPELLNKKKAISE